MRAVLLLFCAFFAAVQALADDGAASVAAGGLVLMKREPRITMAKEVLTISPRQVEVEYEFRNDSADDITTEVAFPIPAYRDEPDQPSLHRLSFDDFKLWVDGQPVRFTAETRALVGRKDITALLLSLHVDAGTFGHDVNYDGPPFYKNPDIDRLAPQQRSPLIASKAIDSEQNHWPRWRVEKKYHWTQTFPAHGVVHIRHEYTPVLGSSNTVGEPESSSVCPCPSLLRALQRAAKPGDATPIGIFYVDFILTTANTWKTPIEDFTLNVKKESKPHYRVNDVSFCWAAPVEKTAPDLFSAHAVNFIPKRELRIGFIRSDWTREQEKANR